MTVIAHKKGELSRFMDVFCSRFAVQHNRTCHRKGQLWERPFKSAVKRGDKSARTNLVYLGNNPVERHLTTKAEDYQWGFLAYYQNSYPFSQPVRRASRSLQRAFKEVTYAHSRGEALVYQQLQRLFRPLERMEKKQLADFIITTYNVIDYEGAIRFFDSYGDMLLAMHANTGAEYDINEPVCGKSDTCYRQMASILQQELALKDIHDVLSYPQAEKHRLFNLLRKKTDARWEQIAAYLHLEVRKVDSNEPVCK